MILPENQELGVVPNGPYKFNYNLTNNPIDKSKLSDTYMHNLKNILTILPNYTPHHCLA
jgi:hypothetical protein